VCVIYQERYKGRQRFFWKVVISLEEDKYMFSPLVGTRIKKGKWLKCRWISEEKAPTKVERMVITGRRHFEMDKGKEGWTAFLSKRDAEKYKGRASWITHIKVVKVELRKNIRVGDTACMKAVIADEMFIPKN